MLITHFQNWTLELDPEPLNTLIVPFKISGFF
jgi:hypothetical protein